MAEWAVDPKLLFWYWSVPAKIERAENKVHLYWHEQWEWVLTCLLYRCTSRPWSNGLCTRPIFYIASQYRFESTPMNNPMNRPLIYCWKQRITHPTHVLLLSACIQNSCVVDTRVYGILGFVLEKKNLGNGKWACLFTVIPKIHEYSNDHALMHGILTFC